MIQKPVFIFSWFTLGLILVGTWSLLGRYLFGTCSELGRNWFGLLAPIWKKDPFYSPFMVKQL